MITLLRPLRWNRLLSGSTSFRARTISSETPTPIETLLRRLPLRYLRASDSSNFDPSTHQRTDVAYESSTGKPVRKHTTTSADPLRLERVTKCDETYQVDWSDGVVSSYSADWVQQHLNEGLDDRQFWMDLTEEQVRESSSLSMEFDDAISQDGMKRALRSLYEYGILLVTKTPIEDAGMGVAALGAALGGGNVKTNPTVSVLANYRQADARNKILLDFGTDGPLRTLYGTVWSTSSAAQHDGSSVADSAYGSDGLPLHTDMTYMRDPPGLQIFTMVRPSTEGGASVFGDGFAVANALRKTNPEAFETLCTITRSYRSMDLETGWNLQASGPVVTLDRVGRIVGIRHNDLDRLSDRPPPQLTHNDEIDNFYHALDQAHGAWDDLLGQCRLDMKLVPGDAMVVANQRCFHGRCSFNTSSPRVVMGCYVSQDELLSRFRMEGFSIC